MEDFKNTPVLDIEGLTCRFFYFKNFCRYGRKCPVPHVIAENRVPDKVCRFFIKGECAFDDQCWNEHVYLSNTDFKKIEAKNRAKLQDDEEISDFEAEIFKILRNLDFEKKNDDKPYQSSCMCPSLDKNCIWRLNPNEFNSSACGPDIKGRSKLDEGSLKSFVVNRDYTTEGARPKGNYGIYTGLPLYKSPAFQTEKYRSKKKSEELRVEYDKYGSKFPVCASAVFTREEDRPKDKSEEYRAESAKFPTNAPTDCLREAVRPNEKSEEYGVGSAKIY